MNEIKRPVCGQFVYFRTSHMVSRFTVVDYANHDNIIMGEDGEMSWDGGQTWVPSPSIGQHIYVGGDNCFYLDLESAVSNPPSPYAVR